MMEERPTNVIYLDICKAFDMSHMTSLSPDWKGMGLKGGLFSGQGTGWMDTARELWSVAMSRQRTVMTVVCQASVLGLVLFNIFISNTGPRQV